MWRSRRIGATSFKEYFGFKCICFILLMQRSPINTMLALAISSVIKISRANMHGFRKLQSFKVVEAINLVSKSHINPAEQ